MPKLHIWTLALDELALEASLLKQCRSLLSEEEQARAQRFYFDIDRNRFLVAHALCRLMLSEQGDLPPDQWQFDKEQKGRPLIRPAQNPQNIDFNLTHTQGMVGCALSFNCRVGLDLEFPQRQVELELLAKKQFSKMEQAQYFAQPTEQRRTTFFKFWNLKEAYIKATGLGLSEPLKGFGFDLNTMEIAFVDPARQEPQWRFGLLWPGAEHQGAWSIDRKVPVIAHRELTMDVFGRMFG